MHLCPASQLTPLPTNMAMMFNSMRTMGVRSVAVAKPAIRRFSGDSHAEHHAHVETWKKITFVSAIPVACVFIRFMITPHEHEEAPPAYPYLRIRNKPFPWGDMDLLDNRHEAHH